MSKKVTFTFSKITERMLELSALEDKFKIAEGLNHLYYWSESCIEAINDVLYSDEFEETLSFRLLREEALRKLTEIEIELSRLRKLLSSLATYALSRTVIDFKSMFRNKVPLLFKNLDDAHITNQIYKNLKFEISYIPHHYTKWKKKRYTRQLQLLTN